VQKSGKVHFFSHLGDLYLILSRPWNLSHFFSHRDYQYNFHVERVCTWLLLSGGLEISLHKISTMGTGTETKMSHWT
jgi:hypothetical protein